MKKVLSGKNLQEKMQESINFLCDIVSTTLGPKGSNVIIDHSLFTPFITNDGATIAKNIESEDEVVNTILEIAKEASLKTNEIVGDGTTTTLVLLQSIFNASLELIKKGENPILLKKELDACLEEILEMLEKEKRIPTKKDLLAIASIAAGDKRLGKIVSDAFEVVKKKSAITIQEKESEDLTLEFQNGYILDTQVLSEYFLNEKKSLHFEQANVLILHDFFSNLENIAFLLNDCLQNKKNLLLFANEYDENVLRELVSLHIENELSCCVLKLTEYGMHQRKIEKDLEILTNAKIVENYELITPENIGTIKNVTISNESTCISFIKENKIQEYISLLKEEAINCKDDFEQSFIEKRIAMFDTGLATIFIGAPTKTECHEKKMRLEDALCALESCNDGILLGGGITILKMANELNPNNNAEIIFKEALEKPFCKILTNAGIDASKVLEDIKKEHYQKIYNVNEDKLESVETTSVLDSFNVVKSSLINATSIATMLFSTTSLVINEYKNNANKTNEYTEI